jgi:hypothetical protein
MSKEKLKCENCGAGANDQINEMVPDSTGIKSYLRCTVCGLCVERNVKVLIAEIDTIQKPAEIKMPVMTGDVWEDFGICLEVCGFMLKNASDATGKSVDELVKYSADYLKRAAEDYTIDK